MLRDKFLAFPKLEDEDLSEHYNVSDRDRCLCTPKQRAYIRGLMNKAHMDEDELIFSLGIDCEELKDFTIDNASEAIDYLKTELGWN